MKTITEISGFTLREAYGIRQELFNAKLQKKTAEARLAKLQPTPGATEASTTEASTAEAVGGEAIAESVGATEGAATVTETTTDAGVEAEAAGRPEIVPPRETPMPPPADPQVVPPMEPAMVPLRETPTEPPADPQVVPPSETPTVPPSRNNRGRGRGRDGGKPRDDERRILIEAVNAELAAELPPLLTEKFKIEGEKLGHMISALEFVDRRRVEDLKRVVVASFTEGEKLPEGAQKKGEFCFIAEYLPSLNPQRERGRFGRGPGRKSFGGKGGRGGRRGRGEGRGEGRGDGRGRGPGGGGRDRADRPFSDRPRREPLVAQEGPGAQANGERSNGERRPRPPRKPRPPIQQKPFTGTLPKPKTADTAPASAEAPPASTPTS